MLTCFSAGGYYFRLRQKAAKYLRARRHGSRLAIVHFLNSKYRSQRSAVFWRNPPSFGEVNIEVKDPPSSGGVNQGELPTMSIENPTLAHFRHFIRRGGFSSLFTKLTAYKAADIYVPIRHYICREPSTNQLLFMQNKPNFQDVQMNVSILLQMTYENISNWTIGQNKPNQTQSNPILVDSYWSLSRTEFTPHFDAGMRGCGDAGQE